MNHGSGQDQTGGEKTPGPFAKHSMSRMATVGICVFLAAIVWMVFGQTLKDRFINYDDDVYVYNNPEVAGGLTLHGVAWAFSHSDLHLWTPMTTLSHMLDCQVFGLEPWGHHLTNVLLHGISAILLFLVLRRMTGAPWRSAFVAAVFAVHPLRAESVAWVTERKDVLSGFFFMLTLWAYERYARRRSWLRYLPVVAVFTLGLMAKQMLVTLPFVLLLLDYWPLKRFTGTQEKECGGMGGLARLIVEKIPLLLLSLVFCLQTLMEGKAAPGSLVPAVHTSWARLGNGFITYLVYIRQTFYPVKLSAFYPFPKTVQAWQVMAAIAVLAVLAAITAAAYAWRRKQPALLAGWLWYLGMLMPVAGFFQVATGGHADRYTYLPQTGLVVAFTWVVSDSCRVLRLHRAVCGGLFVVAIPALVFCAHAQASYWHDSETLWTHAIACAGPSSIACNNLGEALEERGALNEAVTQYQKALDIQPAPLVYYNLANALRDNGESGRAVAEYQKALDIEPQYADAHNNMGYTYLKMGEVDKAIVQYQEVLKNQPHVASAQCNLGVALVQKGDLNAAVDHFRKALELNPDYAEAYYNLGSVMLQTRHPDDAAGCFQRAIVIKPRYAEAHYSLGLCFQQMGQPAGAVAEYQKTLDIERGNTGALNNMAYLLATSPQEKLRNGAKALELALLANQSTRGGDPAMLGTLAAAYAENGRFSEAVETVQHALDLANAQNNIALARLLQTHLELYQAGTPLRVSNP